MKKIHHVPAALAVLFFVLSLPLIGADRYWVHKPFYENTFSTSVELNDWLHVEDNGSGGWQLNGDGTATLTMDDALGNFACRLFNQDGGATRLLPLDATHGRLELMVSAITGGNQRIFIQMQTFDAANTFLGQQNMLPAQSATGFFSINLSDFTFDPAVQQVRFVIGGENYSGVQGTITFDYFSYSNDSGVWNNPANWSVTSGGPGGASVPGPDDVAIFDGGGGSSGSCQLEASHGIGGIRMTAGYAGNLDLQGHALTVGSAGLTVAGGGITGQGASIGIDGDVVISGGVFSNDGGLYALAGDITLSGAPLDFGTDEVVFTGAGDQTFSSPGTTPVHELTVNKPSGALLLTSDVIVTGQLDLTAGRIRTDGYTLQLGDSDAQPGTLVPGAGLVEGTLARWISPSATGSLAFPLGDEDANAPLSLGVTAMPSVGGRIAVTYHDAAPSFGAVSFMDGLVEIGARSAASWRIEVDAVAGGTFSLSAANDHLGTLTDLTGLRLTQATAAVGVHVAATGTLGVPILGRVGLSSGTLAGDWYAALQASALPLTMGRLQAVAEETATVLEWTTLHEAETDYFLVEHATDGTNFRPLGRVTAAGFSSGERAYRFVHFRPVEGTQYYRLRQYDLDGSHSLSDVVTATHLTATTAALKPIGNPVREALHLDVTRRGVRVNVIGPAGRLVLRRELEAGLHRLDCSGWASGVYRLVTMVDGRPSAVHPIVKQ